MFMTGGRGCGNMKSDGLYITWSLGSHGIPINKLVLCPVWTFDRAKMGIGTQGMTILPQLKPDGSFSYTSAGDLVYDLYDHVGEDHYKYKADFFEEVCWGGLSRRIPKTAKFDLLIPGKSVHYLCHSNSAIAPEHIELVRNSVNRENTPQCLWNLEQHKLPFQSDFMKTCSAMWWHEHYEKDTVAQNGEEIRHMPSFSYHVYSQAQKLEYNYGAFMVFPIGTFVGTTTKSGDISEQMEKALKTLKARGFNTTVLDLNTDEVENE